VIFRHAREAAVLSQIPAARKHDRGSSTAAKTLMLDGRDVNNQCLGRTDVTVMSRPHDR
jgi:hypothetical protein